MEGGDVGWASDGGKKNWIRHKYWIYIMARQAVESERRSRNRSRAFPARKEGLFPPTQYLSRHRKLRQTSRCGGPLSISFSASDGFLCRFYARKSPPVSPLEAQKFPPLLVLLRIRHESSSMVNGVLNLRDDSTRIVGGHPPGLHINSWCTVPRVYGGASERATETTTS